MADAIDFAVRHAKRKRDLDQAATKECAIFYTRWGTFFPDVRIIPPDADDLSISVRHWKYLMKQYDSEVKTFKKDQLLKVNQIRSHLARAE